MKLIFLFIMVFAGQAFALVNPLPKSSPERNFEAFWLIFNKHYAHFETRNVDWQKQYHRYRNQVTPATSDAELLAILTAMVAPLKDGHVVISPTGDLPASAQYAPFYQEFPTKALQAGFREVTIDQLRKQGFGPFVSFKSAPYQIGGYCRSKDYGYLQLNGFGGMPIPLFCSQLDDMVRSFTDVKGLILDIRINGGGSPAYLEALVGRLIQVKQLTGFGRSRISQPKQEYSPWSAYFVSPQGEKQLIKPTVLLTSGATISAGDHCALYLKELPYVKLIGENSNGIFSAMSGHQLPNGWQLSLSNGQTVSARRVSYEGRGVPVDVAVTHHRSQMQQGIDPGLDVALEYLKTRQDELVIQTRCYEQLALDFFADSLLASKTYGDITAYSTGLVEEDATLLAPFAQKCTSLQQVPGKAGVQERIRAEVTADTGFYQQNIKRRFYVRLPDGIRSHMQWPFTKRNARRLTIAHHISIDNKKYVRIHLSQGGGKGETVLVVLDQDGHVLEHCGLSYNYLSSQFYR
nr:S41 family peptidase [uncultured Arsenicibacter sp.]